MAAHRTRYPYRCGDPNLPGVIHVTIDLARLSCGTGIDIVQEGIPEVIPVEMCYLGWQESLAQLAQLVEPEIPGGVVRRHGSGSRGGTVPPAPTFRIVCASGCEK